MNASSSPTSNFIDALISSKSATVNVSQWYSNILNLYSSKVDRLNRKKKWIDLAKRFLAYKFKENLYNEQATISKYVFVDATKLIWRSLSKKLLLYSRINVIKYFHAQLLRVNYERHFNIKIQWKSYAWALLHGLESPKHSYRELWRSYAFLIKKKKIKEAQHNCDKFSFHGKTQTRIIWQRFFRFIISDFRIKQMRKKVKAIAILTQFFNHSLIRFRAKKAAEAVQSVIPNCDIVSIDNLPENLNEYYFTAIGYWVDRGLPDAKSKKFIRSLKNMNVALFGTLGAYPDSPHAKGCIRDSENMLKTAGNNNNVLGSFLCLGKIDSKLMDYMGKFMGDTHPVTPERKARLMEAQTHPDNNDLENAKAVFKGFAERLGL